jgi:hypothetical protein
LIDKVRDTVANSKPGERTKLKYIFLQSDKKQACADTFENLFNNIINKSFDLVFFAINDTKLGQI